MLLRGQPRAEPQREPAVVDVDLLLGELHSRCTSGCLGCLDPAVQLGESDRKIGRCHRVVRQLGVVAYDRPFDPVQRRGPVGRDTHGEHHRRTIDVGQQAGGALAEDRRIQRGPPIGQVHRDRPLERLDVERIPRLHEPADIGDRVVQDHVVAGQLDRERLIEIDR